MSELIKKIEKLKKSKNAIILAHVYTSPEIQDIADFVGDSLGLSRKAAEKSEAEIIVFCGVYFMAETAALLSPDKKVLIPDPKAGCPMADMIDARDVREMRVKYPNAAVVCYVNSTVEVKAEADICVTSANAVAIVRKLPEKQIIFIPDKSLGAYVQTQVPEKELILWPGFCPTHHRILEEFLVRMKNELPNALVLAHPENTQNILNKADFIGSTGQIQKYVQSSLAQEFLIGTENGLIYRLQKDNPGKKFYPVTPLAVCPNMKKATLEKVLEVLENESNQVVVKTENRPKALQSIQRMLALS